MNFRQATYDFFPFAADAAMNLMDALSASPANSIIELSLSPHFTRRHSSIARAIQDYKQGRDKEKEVQCDPAPFLSAHLPKNNEACHFFAIDVSSVAKPYSKKLPCREIVHTNTVIPGQKPITIGLAVSCVNMLSRENTWSLPMASERVTQVSQTIFGLRQAEKLDENFNDKISIFSADAKYPTKEAVVLTHDWNGKILLSRLADNRVFYYPYQAQKKDAKKKGKKRTYGDAFKLNDESTWREANIVQQVTHTTNQGKVWQVQIERFDELLMKGKRELKLKEKPVSIFKITVTDQQGKLIFPKPLWLLGSGKPTKDILLADIFMAYHLRFNIEHWFRFSKQHFFFDRFQTADIQHFDNWLLFPMLATHQLYHARGLAGDHFHAWESKKNTNPFSPSQVKRSMSSILQQVGTPATEPKPRGIGKGRAVGSFNRVQKIRQTVQYKKPKSTVARKITIKLNADSMGKLSDAQLIAHQLPNIGNQLKESIMQSLNQLESEHISTG